MLAVPLVYLRNYDIMLIKQSIVYEPVFSNSKMHAETHHICVNCRFTNWRLTLTEALTKV